MAHFCRTADYAGTFAGSAGFRQRLPIQRKSGEAVLQIPLIVRILPNSADSTELPIPPNCRFRRFRRFRGTLAGLIGSAGPADSADSADSGGSAESADFAEV